MRKLTIILILGMFLITLVSASQEELGTFKQGDCMQLKQSCTNCTYVNFTKVSYPDSTIALTEVEAEKNGMSYNYTFCNTTQLGIYIVEGFGDNGGTNSIFVYDFEITKTGLNFTTKESIIHIGLIFGLVAVSIFFLLFSRNTEEPGVRLFLNLISYLMMFLSVGAGYILLQSVQTNMLPVINIAVYTIGIVLIIIMFYIFINLTRHSLALMRAKKGFGSEFDNPSTF